MAENNDEISLVLNEIEAGDDADKRPIFKGLEAVRHRPGMFVGDTGANGLHHLFKEIIDNAIDEVRAGHCTEIKVIYGADYSLSVEDNGRGIPVEKIVGTGKTGVELVLTELRAGGKFFGGRKVPGALHGVGAASVNALSAWLECEVRRDGTVYRQRFERGVPTGPLTVVGTCPEDEQGTKITWLADDTIFGLALDEEGHLQYSPERLRMRINQLAFLNKEVSISFQDAHNGKDPEIYHYKRGIADYVPSVNAAKVPIHPKVIYFYQEREGTQVEIAMQYNAGSQEAVFCFANNIHNSEGGTHFSGFKTALTRTVNRYARKNSFLTENETNFTSEAVRIGLTAIISLRLANPQFYSADTVRLTNPEMEGMVRRVVSKGLATFFSENPEVARVIMDKIRAGVQAQNAG